MVYLPTVRSRWGAVWEAFRFMEAYKLYDIEPPPNKKRISYAIYLSEYETPMILIDPAEYNNVFSAFGFV